MKTIVRNVENKDNKEAIREAAGLLREGKLVAFPTETVYGLGGSGWMEEAASRIYEAKGRPSDNPLILHRSHLAYRGLPKKRWMLSGRVR